MGFYTNLGGSSRPRSSSRTTDTSPAASVRNLQAAAKLERAQQLVHAIDAISGLHRQQFAQSKRPVAQPVPVHPLEDVQKSIRSYALQQVSVFKRSERTRAKAWADSEAIEEHKRLVAAAAGELARRQAELDGWWSDLCANDPATVLGTLAAAFDDNEAPAAAVGVSGDDVSLVVLVPDTDVLPERIPSVTDAGNLSLRNATKTKSAALYLSLVCGYVLVTVKEAFAVAVGIRSAAVVVLRHRGVDSYGKPRMECILAGHIRREALSGIRWESTESPRVLDDAADNMMILTKGAARELVALDLKNEAGIAAVVAAVDVEQLVRAP